MPAHSVLAATACGVVQEEVACASQEVFSVYIRDRLCFCCHAHTYHTFVSRQNLRHAHALCHGNNEHLICVSHEAACGKATNVHAFMRATGNPGLAH